MHLIDWIGTLAACLTTASFMPQAWHTFRTRDVSGISLGMYSLFTVGVMLWLVYGILLGAWPIIVANAISQPGHRYIVDEGALPVMCNFAS